MNGTSVATRQSNVAPKASELTFSELEASARNDRRKGSLDRVRKACDDLEQKDLKIGPTSVAKRISERYKDKLGPIAQSISNDSNGLARYVSERERERQAKSKTNGVSRGGRGAQDLLRMVTDGDARLMIMNLEDRCLAAEKTAEHARRLLSSIHPGINMEALASGDASRILPAGGPAVSAAQAHGLRSLLSKLSDEKLLAEFRLRTDATGAIRRDGGLNDEMIPAALLRNLAEVVGMLEGTGKKSDGF